MRAYVGLGLILAPLLLAGCVTITINQPVREIRWGIDVYRVHPVYPPRPMPFGAVNAHTSGSADACPLRFGYSPAGGGQGTVSEILSQQTAMALLVRTQQMLGAPINGAYINNTRVGVHRDGGGEATVLIPYGMTIAVGDRIAFQGSYRSPGLACSYVPNLATRRF